MKQNSTIDIFELETLFYDIESLSKLLFSAIKYNEENNITGSYSYIAEKIEKCLIKMRKLF